MAPWMSFTRTRPRAARAGFGRVGALIGALAGLALVSGLSPATAQTKLVVNQSAQSLSAAPVYLANDLGYFAKEGLSVSFVPTGSGMKSISPLLSGDTQFCICIFSHPVDAMQAGAGEIRIIGQIMTGYNHKIVLSKAVAEAKKITPQTPLAERIQALKGLKIGISEPNASTDQVIRLLMQSQNLDPSSQSVLIALGALNLPPALQNKQIDAYDMSPPVPEQSVEAGDGITLIDLGKDKVPLLDKAVYMVVAADPDYLKKNQKVAVGFMRAIAQAQTYLAEHPDEARKLLKEKDFPKMDQHIFDIGFAANQPFYAKKPDVVRAEIDAGLDLARKFTKGTLNVTYDKLVDTSVVGQLSQ